MAFVRTRAVGVPSDPAVPDIPKLLAAHTAPLLLHGTENEPPPAVQSMDVNPSITQSTLFLFAAAAGSLDTLIPELEPVSVICAAKWEPKSKATIK